MKIGFVSLDHLRDWHGTTRLIDRIAKEMSNRGHGVVIIAREGTASAKIPVSTFDYPHELIAVNLDSPQGRGTAREKIAASGIDVCMASINDSSLLYLPGLFLGSGIPYIFGDPHEPLVFTFSRWQPYESYGAMATADAIQTLLPNYIPLYPKALQPRVTEIGIPSPLPAEIDFTARRESGKRVIVSVGRFVERNKRFSLLLRAFALLCKDFPDWRLKLVGDGPYWDIYQEMARQLGIHSRVDFTGAVADPAPHYSDADIFCLPSRTEGFPLVISEAASYALPLVGFRTCIALDTLIEPDIGVLAESGPDGDTPGSLAEALRGMMLLPPKEREAIGLRARDKLQEKYGGGVIFDKWEKLLRETFEKTGARNETALERITKKMCENRERLGPEWDGLGPDSPVWTDVVLESAAAEISARDDPMKFSGQSAAGGEAGNVRLRCELARLRQDYNGLEKKYATLAGQYQMLAGKRGKRAK